MTKVLFFPLKMKILIGINVLESVNSFVYSSHIKFFATIKKQYPEIEFLLFTPYRMSIDNMRNTSVRIAKNQNCDYILFLDDDVIVQPDTFKMLFEANKDIIMALTFVRGMPFPPMLFKAVGITVDENGKRKESLTAFDDYRDFIDSEGLVECAAVGFSCVLIKMELIDAVSPPYFVTGPNHTEDVYFCMKARHTLEPMPSIFTHTKCPTMHMMMADGVTDYNVEKLRELYASGEPLQKSRLDRIQDCVKELS